MFQIKQRRTYLADQACEILLLVVVAEKKLEDMAGPVAAPDASPPAAVLLVEAASSLPRCEDACRVLGDALLEGEQRIPLVPDAACPNIVGVGVTKTWWLLGLMWLLRIGKAARRCRDEQHE